MTVKVAQRKEKSLSTLIKEADTVFSTYIRLRDQKAGNGQIHCFICGTRLTFAQACCGHWIRRDKMPTRFSELNCHSLCYECNMNDEIDHGPYNRAMVERYHYRADDLRDLLTLSNSLQKYSRFEIGEIIQEYKGKGKTTKVTPHV